MDFRAKIDRHKARAGEDRSFRERYSFLIVVSLMLLTGLAVFVNTSLFAIPALAAWGLLGYDIIYIGIESGRKALRSREWPTVKGTLINAASRMRKCSAGSGASYKYFLDLEYSYLVGGVAYRGRQYNWVGIAKDKKEDVEEIIKSLQNSARSLTVFYNPDRHSEAVLKPEFSIIYILGVLVGVGFVSASMVGILDQIGLVELQLEPFKISIPQ